MRVSRSGVLATGVGLLAVAAAVWATSRVTLIDLAVYRAGAGAVLQGRALYDAHPSGSLLPFTYPPFAALALAPLGWLAQAPAQALFTAASLLALVRVCAIVLAASRRSGGDRAGAVLVAAAGLALCAEPVARTLAFGQVNLVLMWVVVEDVLGAGARVPKAQGVLVGLAAGVKLVPGAFALLFLAVGRRRAAVVAGATFLATLAVGFLLQPAASHDYWSGLLFDPSRMGDVAAVDNQSLLGTLSRTLPEDAVRASWIPVAAATLVTCLVLARWYWRRGLRLVPLSLVASAGLLCSPISWSHHWVWLVVLVAACAELWYLRPVRIVTVLVVLAPGSWVVWWAGTSAFAWLPGPVAVVVDNAYVLVGLAFVAVLWSVRGDVVPIEPAEAQSESGPWPDDRETAARTP